MALTIHRKLASIVEEIDREGFAELVRLSVLKKWFDKPGRLTAFALWIAEQATTGKASAYEPEAALLAQVRALLAHLPARGDLNPQAMRELHGRLEAFQPDYRSLKWGRVRLVNSKALMLIEEALAICLRHPDDPRFGYKLAAYYCEHYSSKYGNNLNGPSRDRVREIAEFVARRQVDEIAFPRGISVLGEP
jgi:hypothetical protein